MKNILLLLTLAFQLNFSLLFSGEVKLVGKVKLEESDIKNLSAFLEVSQISKSGKFAIANIINGSSDSIVMDSNGKYLRFKNQSSSRTSSTNILGTIVENGVLKVIQSEKQEFIGETNDGLAIFNTFSTNGYISVVNQQLSVAEKKFKIITSSNSSPLTSRIPST